MTQHTPGPWTVEDPLGAEVGLAIVQSGLKAYEWEFIAMTCQSDAGGELVGRQRFISPEEQEANARLIAAAPDMIAALRRAESALVRAYGEPATKASKQDALGTVAIVDARAAIAKAEGAQ